MKKKCKKITMMVFKKYEKKHGLPDEKVYRATGMKNRFFTALI
jgi:hypothetical protein